MFSGEFCEISKNAFSYRTFPVAASESCLTDKKVIMAIPLPEDREEQQWNLVYEKCKVNKRFISKKNINEILNNQNRNVHSPLKENYKHVPQINRVLGGLN